VDAFADSSSFPGVWGDGYPAAVHITVLAAVGVLRLQGTPSVILACPFWQQSWLV